MYAGCSALVQCSSAAVPGSCARVSAAMTARLGCSPLAGWHNAIRGRGWRRVMATLIYSMIASLDGYIADAQGSFDWAFPDEEVHAFINDLVRPTGAQLYGRRMYEVMAAWETMHTVAGLPPHMLDFATIWQAADKIVYSRTLESV